MPNWAICYVRRIEALNYRLGRIVMYLLFVIMGVLLWSSLTKVIRMPSLWTLEVAQFTLVAYYLLGAPYSMQLGANVRMDLLYARMPVKRQAIWDIFTIFCLLFYLGVMLWGAVDSTAYSFRIGERAPSAWRPPLWPIKVVITISFALMILQAIAHLIRDIAILRNVDIPRPFVGEVNR
ncbi:MULTISPECIES: TRAP transporter small permease subunit [Paracoccus]|jgi:TRAP-type mannitol/chloroaromatic compound transport system permease small subunit|uniref:TRAP transporter small permease protein n=1 Tax=Paracoccus denitrificans (strain Pd 1222) TaxID=318586 RepID=A1BAR3_PARDP|nr:MULTISPECIES: TRAP transporter small permease subunit [Paracoccus]ABL72607.1 Tripartite ATP-independent periplasmic transporter, DctQ component [Paracoccus denitrificans PD1222]MBB4630255.1 TRAP-type mannitol/chloroaromatic compound transport system permease small subunit [Paracoccus denitrificans]MCU7431619.1 TRAP transporter small permease subunit [Paracoccus denitrificans]MDK8875519.1 TRAP transporter small permease subunit [Paracoccus sp. SSJ]QAR29590.1 TRAP transporter small permease s